MPPRASLRASGRTRRPRPAVPDPCPHCAADLGGTDRTTRREIVWTPEPGVFVWRCPECRGAWSDDTHAAPAVTP